MPTLDFTRNPDLGDSIITNDFSTVRRNLQNEVNTVRSSHWPTVDTFRFEVSGLSEAKKDEIIQFLRDNAGKEISILDYNSVKWTGIVIDDPVTQQMGPDIIDNGEGERVAGCTFKIAMSLEGHFDLP